MDYLNDTFDTSLTYDEAKEFGHASAGKNLMMSLDGSGGDADHAVLAANRARLLGGFLELRRNKRATVQVLSQRMVMAGDQNAFRVGAPVVGAGSGKAKSPAARTNSYVQNTEEEWANARGLVLEVLTNTTSGSTAEVLFF